MTSQRAPKAKALTPAQQFLNLQNGAASRGGEGRLRPNSLIWKFDARPTPVSRTYHARLTYRAGGVPEVVVHDPDLVELAGGRRLPHVYKQRPARLCLYLPQTTEWTPILRLSETVIPWTILWLFYFEEWLQSNEWKGGGIHPLPS